MFRCAFKRLNFWRSISSIVMHDEETSTSFLFLSNKRCATFLLMSFFSTFIIAANWRPFMKLGTDLIKSEIGKIKPEECFPKTCLSFC